MNRQHHQDEDISFKLSPYKNRVPVAIAYQSSIGYKALNQTENRRDGDSCSKRCSSTKSLRDFRGEKCPGYSSDSTRKQNRAESCLWHAKLFDQKQSLGRIRKGEAHTERGGG